MGVNVKIVGAGAYLTEDGADRPRPFGPGDIVSVTEQEAERLVADGVGLYAEAVSDPEPPIEDQYSDMDLAALRAAAVDLGIEGMERANTKTVLSALREQESAGESESRIGSGERR